MSNNSSLNFKSIFSTCFSSKIKFLVGAFFLFFSQGSFSQTVYTFTNAGATGRFGPTQTQINTVYQGTNLANQVTIDNSTQGIQEWVVPFSGKYKIEVAGAQGGYNNSYALIGGKGAKMVGEFDLVFN